MKKWDLILKKDSPLPKIGDKYWRNDGFNLLHCEGVISFGGVLFHDIPGDARNTMVPWIKVRDDLTMDNVNIIYQK